jgi:hypothetical protein
MNKLLAGMGIALLFAMPVFGQAKVGIDGTVSWDKVQIDAVVSLDLASVGLKLPAGRRQGETYIQSEYIRLIRPHLLNLRVDSSSTIGNLIERGEWSLLELENIALQARSVPPALSPDFSRLLASYTLGLSDIVTALIRHERPMEPPRTLTPVSAPAYTGIVIMASESLPVHGMKSTALVQPCLFPKIWDTEMNLIFERNMLNPKVGIMARYFSSRDIFASNVTGLSPEIAAVVGERPLRIFAQGVFGSVPTDPVIDRDDALQIISTNENRRLLNEGRVAIIIDDAALRSMLKGE